MIPNDIIELQNETVNKLLDIVSHKRETLLKSPTGSGKTHMMAHFMSEMLKRDNEIVFLISTLSTNGLNEQNYEKFKEYQHRGEFLNLDLHLITIENQKLQQEKTRLNLPNFYNTYVLGNQKLIKGGTMLNYFESWLDEFKHNGKKLYLIRDEGHRATNNLDEYNHYFDKIINFTATPGNSIVDVELDEEEAMECGLIKCIDNVSEREPNYTLEDALDKFLEIRSNYLKLFDDRIRPCMLIQVSNEEKFRTEEYIRIKSVLEKEKYNKKFKWIYLTGNNNECETNDSEASANVTEKELKELAEPDNSPIDIIIFKLIAKEGWDVRRACVLYQERNSQSNILKQQVIGRTRRNPVLTEYDKYKDDKDKFMTAYIYGIQEPCENTVAVQLKSDFKDIIQKEVQICTTSLSLSEKNKVGIDEIINKNKSPDDFPSKSIFDLYKLLNSCPSDLANLIKPHINSYEDWVWLCNNIKTIKSAYNLVACDYENNIDFVRDENNKIKYVSFPDISSFVKTEHNLSVNCWVWQRNNQDDVNKFSFDSSAEQKWSDILKEIANIKNGYFWGKNFKTSSEICFKYYNDGIHTSYPDFVLKDKKQRIHIMEVKSLTEKKNVDFDTEEYKEKIKALQEGYKWFALLTGHIFYIPIFMADSKDGHWEIIRIMRNKNFPNENWKKELHNVNGDIDKLLCPLKPIKLSEFQSFIEE